MNPTGASSYKSRGASEYRAGTGAPAQPMSRGASAGPARAPNEAQRLAFERALRERLRDAQDEAPAAVAGIPPPCLLLRESWAQDLLDAPCAADDRSASEGAGVQRAASVCAATPNDEALPREFPPEPSATAAKAAREAALDQGLSPGWTGLPSKDANAWQLSLGGGHGPSFELQARRPDAPAAGGQPVAWQLGLLASGIDRQQFARQAQRLGERLRELGLAEGEIEPGYIAGGAAQSAGKAPTPGQEETPS